MDSSTHLVARAGIGSNSERPPVYKIIGIVLAVSSGLFIGTSFVLKKVGLLKANLKYNEEAGEGYGYLKNAYWWSGMTLMIIGEICNFVAYAFVDAILVTPMGALSVVVTAILSAIFLKERLSFVGKIGCFMCIIGSIVIALNSPEQSAAATIQQMQTYVLSPGFLTYAGVIIVGCIVVAVWAGPKYGKKSMLVYLSICSLIGGLSVVATQGLGAAIVTQISGTPQFNQWFLYVLAVFVICTLVTEIIYLNKALNIFNAALVTPTYYVYFTSATIVTSAILFRGFKGTAVQIITIVMGFLTICSGVVLLQLSKSAKDVPDTAVFNGDLDQVRTIAEQEEHESEPKADVIRGASGIVRAISKNKLRREAEEARRVHEERLEPIGENEVVEWDGLRRRKTVLQPGQTAPTRSKTLHYPLGLTHFPDDSDSESEPLGKHANVGLFSSMRRKATTALHPRRAASDRSVSYGSQPGDQIGGKSAVPLDSINIVPMPSDSKFGRVTASASPGLDDISDLGQSPHYGISDHGDTSYRSPSSIMLRQENRATLAPHNAVAAQGDRRFHNRRQFSFQNVFSGRNRSVSNQTTTSSIDQARPSSSDTVGKSSFLGIPRRRAGAAGETEEERLGLVKGDNHAVGSGLSPVRSSSPDIADEPSARTHQHDGGVDGQPRDELDYYDDDLDESFEALRSDDEDWSGHYDSRGSRNGQHGPGGRGAFI